MSLGRRYNDGGPQKLGVLKGVTFQYVTQYLREETVPVLGLLHKHLLSRNNASNTGRARDDGGAAAPSTPFRCRVTSSRFRGKGKGRTYIRIAVREGFSKERAHAQI